MASRRVLLLSTLLVAGCVSSTLPKPEVTSVTPDTVQWTDRSFTLVVNGDNFASGIVPDADNAADSIVDRARLELVSAPGPVVLVAGSYLGPTEIRVSFAPGDIPAGDFTVIVHNPDDTSAESSATDLLQVRAPPTQLAWAASNPPNTVVSDTTGGAVLRVNVLDDNEESSVLRDGTFTAGILLDSPNAIVTAFSIADGAAFSTFTVSDTVAEDVVLEIDPAALAAAGLTITDVTRVRFDADVPFSVEIPGGTEAQPTDNFVVTRVELRDQFGNLAKFSPPMAYQAVLDPNGGTCNTEADVLPDPTVTVPAGSTTSGDITITCTSDLDVLVEVQTQAPVSLVDDVLAFFFFDT